MELESDDYPSYHVKLQTADGREILSRQAGKIRLDKDRSFASLIIPGKILAKGDYVLILSGQEAEGGIEEIDRYLLQVS